MCTFPVLSHHFFMFSQYLPGTFRYFQVTFPLNSHFSLGIFIVFAWYLPDTVQELFWTVLVLSQYFPRTFLIFFLCSYVLFQFWPTTLLLGTFLLLSGYFPVTFQFISWYFLGTLLSLSRVHSRCFPISSSYVFWRHFIHQSINLYIKDSKTIIWSSLVDWHWLLYFVFFSSGFQITVIGKG